MPWYVWHSGDIEDPEPCYENTLIFIISSLQLIAVCLAFSIGKPFRKPFYRNIALTCTIVLLSGLTVCFVLLPYEQILQLGEIVKFPIEF